MANKLLLASMIFIIVFMSACTEQNAYPVAPSPAPTVVTAPPAPQTTHTDIANYRFSDVTIKVGDTVVWTNQDAVLHTVTSDSGNELNSPQLTNGQTYSHTFIAPGVYTYYSNPYPSVRGKVTVEN